LFVGLRGRVSILYYLCRCSDILGTYNFSEYKLVQTKVWGTAAKPMGEDTELPGDAGLHSHSGSGSDTLLKERKKTPKSPDQDRHVLTHQGADSLSSDVAVNLIISGGPPGNQKYKIGNCYIASLGAQLALDGPTTTGDICTVNE
jgi:hypothetical protein